MAIDFPNSPATNDTHTVDNRTWEYDGEKWCLVTTLTNIDLTLNDVTVNGNLTADYLYTSGGYFNVYADTVLDGTITVQAIREKVSDGTISTNVLTCSHLTAGVFYVTSPSANFTANVTNLPTDDGFTATVSIFVQQGSTGYYPNALQIAGTGQTIKWSGGTAPTPTSSSGKIDLFTFTMIRRSSAWTVLGSANLNY